MQILPVTISLAETCTPSAWKIMVPASSLLRLDNVMACFLPRAVIRQFAPDFNFAPSLVQEPSTSAWLSSTSRVTVSVSCALVSVKPLITWIFFTEEKGRKWLSWLKSEHTLLEDTLSLGSLCMLLNPVYCNLKM